MNYLVFRNTPLNLPPVAEAGGYCLEHTVCNLNLASGIVIVLALWEAL